MPWSRFRLASLQLAALTLIAAAVATLSGCGKSDRLETYSVTGKVTFPDGTPLKGGHVTFRSVDHRQSATGAIQPDGTFQLTTYEPDDGAVAGRHRVVVVAPLPDVDPDEVEVVPLVDPRFEDWEKSGLEFTVSEDGPNDFSVRVEPP